jgi:glucose-6-phosphate dehydrogenase assembly protein OpcA
VTDSAATENAHEVLLQLSKAYMPGDTDFGWTRATPWRSVIAATLDQQVPAMHAAQVAAEPGNPTADLIAAWLSQRLGIPVRRTDSAGPGITGVFFSTDGGDVMLTRADGRTAILSWPGRPDRSVALHRRDIAELLAEELRRLDPDDVYAETLQFLRTFTPPTAPWTADA